MKYFMASIQALLLLCVAKHSWGQTTDFEANWPSLEKHKAVPEWFADAKFGIYFHYGVYSVPGWGGEWYPRWMYVNNRVGWGEKIYQYHQDTYGKNFQYHDFIPMWKADKFDAASWVDLFADSGAKIIGSIAEHHDGFSLWESKANPWNAKDMGPKIDIVRAIQQETKKKGLKFMTTFHHGFHMNFYPHKTASVDRPDRELLLENDTIFPSQDPEYRLLYGNIGYAEANNLWINKLNEVIDGYSPDFIWMDFGQRYIKETYRQQFLANYFNHAQRQGKEVLVNTKGDFFPKSLAIVNVERATMQDITPNVWITDFILGGRMEL
ncbi:alpha-L-fucosidase-like protein [Dyadobacter jejuensis]|uniref:alpha-L-fucosidase n=1 Tax=Dyadobacter jejuensis TaxID=1082580 RepID=A0A316ALN8_9BACT|nr:alpha-L-fucosidase [Dyadobacter jejuensis]PWJ57974.1 alpha-L-fucosidase-like protein [Dyadobacter jejuensis]